MADNSSELERVYTIPLRNAKAQSRARRADNAVRDVRRFLARHMKSDKIWLNSEVNHLLWAGGKFNIPSRIRVRATRFADGVVEVTLPESEATGSIREALAERREKAAETPVLAPAEHEEHEGAFHDHRAVTLVTGIGPATAEKLEEKAGIEDLGQLASADAGEVAAAIGQGVEKVEEWITAAQALIAESGDGKEAAHDSDEEAKADDSEEEAKADDSEE